MARGYFRTDKKTCVCCGASGEGVTTYRLGKKNIPSYECEKCFDKYATDAEKLIKNDLVATINGVEIKKQRKKKLNQ